MLVLLLLLYFLRGGEIRENFPNLTSIEPMLTIIRFCNAPEIKGLK